MGISIGRRAWCAAGVHALLAVLHVYWATGLTWPAADERSLSTAVLGGEASFAPGVVLPLAGFHLAAAAAVLVCAVLAPQRTRWWRVADAVAHLLVLGLVAGLSARAFLGAVWALGVGTDTGTAFYWLNLLVYLPVCLALVAADLAIARHSRPILTWLHKAAVRRAAVIVPVSLMLVLSLAAYGYQPAEQPRQAPSAGSRYVDTGLARFHYLRQGSGSPVVLLSPGAAPASAWQAQLDALSARHTVYVVDLPGQGHTELKSAFHFDLQGMTDAVGAFLDAVQLRTVTLGGNSWSGGWALAYAQRHPDRVDRLLLLASSGLAERDPASWELLKLPLAGELMSKLGTGHSLVESAVRGLFVHQELVTPELVDAMWTQATFAGNVRAMYELERGLDWRVTEAALPGTRQPTLVVWGAQDTVLPVAQAGRFGALLPAATVRVLEGCGHALTLDCPDRVTALLQDFLR